MNWGAFVVQVLREWAPFSAEAIERRQTRKARRRKRKGKELTPEQERLLEKHGQAPEDGEVMDQQIVTQILLGIVRHAMTATGVGVYFSDDLMVQVVSALVALGGAIWMARRKIKAAKPA